MPIRTIGGAENRSSCPDSLRCVEISHSNQAQHYNAKLAPKFCVTVIVKKVGYWSYEIGDDSNGRKLWVHTMARTRDLASSTIGGCPAGSVAHETSQGAGRPHVERTTYGRVLMAIQFQLSDTDLTISCFVTSLYPHRHHWQNTYTFCPTPTILNQITHFPRGPATARIPRTLNSWKTPSSAARTPC